MDDLAQTITLTDGATLNAVEVSVLTGTVTIKGAVQVVSSAPLVRHGSVTSVHPAVLGDQLFAYLSTLVTIFNAHLHAPVPAVVVDTRGYLRTAPHLHGLEAFFGAVLIRRS